MSIVGLLFVVYGTVELYLWWNKGRPKKSFVNKEKEYIDKEWKGLLIMQFKRAVDDMFKDVRNEVLKELKKKLLGMLDNGQPNININQKRLVDIIVYIIDIVFDFEKKEKDKGKDPSQGKGQKHCNEKKETWDWEGEYKEDKYKDKDDEYK